MKPDIQIRANLRPGVKDPLSVVKSFVSNNQDQWMEFCQEYNDCKGAMKISRTDFVKCLKVHNSLFSVHVEIVSSHFDSSALPRYNVCCDKNHVLSINKVFIGGTGRKIYVTYMPSLLVFLALILISLSFKSHALPLSTISFREGNKVLGSDRGIYCSSKQNCRNQDRNQK